MGYIGSTRWCRLAKTTPQHCGMQRNVMATRFEAAMDLITIPGARGRKYVHGGADGIHAKLGIAETAPLEDKALFTRCNFEELSVNEIYLSNYSTAYDRLWARGPH